MQREKPAAVAPCAGQEPEKTMSIQRNLAGTRHIPITQQYYNIWMPKEILRTN